MSTPQTLPESYGMLSYKPTYLQLISKTNRQKRCSPKAWMIFIVEQQQMVQFLKRYQIKKIAARENYVIDSFVVWKKVIALKSTWISSVFFFFLFVCPFGKFTVCNSVYSFYIFHTTNLECIGNLSRGKWKSNCKILIYCERTT